MIAREPSLRVVGVTVERGEPPPLRPERGGGPGLVVGERLGGGQVDGGVPGAGEAGASGVDGDPERPLGGGGDDGHQVPERLSRTRRRAHDGVAAVEQRLGELRLMPPRRRDAGPLDPRDRLRRQPWGPRRRQAGGRLAARDGHRLVPAEQPVELHAPTLPATSDEPFTGDLGPSRTALSQRAGRSMGGE